MGTNHRGTDDEIRALDAYVKLSRAAAAVEAAVNRHLSDAGLTISQFGVLEALWHLGPLSQGALARKILKSPANLTTVLDNLERRGLIHRRRDPRDRRVVIVEASEAGAARIEALFPRHVRRVVDAFAALDADQQDRLGDLCRTLGLAQGRPDRSADAAGASATPPRPATPLEEPG